MPSLFLLLTSIAAALAASPPPVRIRMVAPLENSAHLDHALGETISRFNAAGTEFQVDITKGGGTFQVLRSIIAAHYARDLPDVALVGSSDITTLANLGVLEALPDAWVAGKKFNPALMSGQKCQGGACSVPFSRRIPIWFFNQELLFKLKQNTDRIPTNWAKLSVLATQLRKPGELWPIATPATGEAALVRWSALGFPHGGFTSELTTDWVSKLWTGNAVWLPGSPSAEEATRWFLEQRAVLLLGSLDQLSFLKTSANFRYSTALPEGDLTWFGTDFVVLTKDKKRLAMVRQLLDHLYKPEVALQLFKAAPTIPVTQIQADNPLWRKEIDSWPTLKTALGRKLRSAGTEKLGPQVREEYTTLVWEAINQAPGADERPAKAAELKARLQKVLSSNPR